MLARLKHWWHEYSRPSIPPEVLVDQIDSGGIALVDKRDVGAVMRCAQDQDRLSWVDVEMVGDFAAIRACPPRSRKQRGKCKRGRS